MHWSTERKIVVGLCAALLSLVIIRATAVRGSLMGSETQDRLARASHIISTLDATLVVIQDAETGQRGYLITGDKRYLEPYDRALEEYGKQMETLRSLTADNSDHQARIRTLDQRARAKFAELDETIRVHDNEGFTAASQIVLTDRGRVLMEGVRQQIEEMSRQEKAVLETCIAEAHTLSQSRWVRFFAITSIELLAGGMAMVLVLCYLRRKEHAENESLKLNENLVQEVADRQTLFDLAPIGICVTDDADCKSVRMNRAMRELLRLPDENAPRIPLSDSVVSGYRICRDGKEIPSGELPLQLAASTGKAIHHSEFDLVFSDGAMANIVSNAAPLLGKDGKPRGAIAAMWDITENRRVESELRESREFFRGAFAESPIGKALVSPQGRWLKVNKALCEIVGYSEAELLSLDFQSITHPDDLKADLDHIRRLLDGEIKTYQLEKRYIQKSGKTVWIKVNVALVRNEEGRPLYFISQMQDITASRRTLEELNRFFRIARDIICVAGMDGYFKRVNPAACELLGYSEPQLLAKPFEEFILPEDRDATHKEVVRLQSGEPVISFENRYRCADGSVKWISWHASPIVSENLIYAIGRDVTEQRNAVESIVEARRAAEAASRAKSAFLANMSHEIRTPLTTIFSFADMLLIPDLPLADRLDSVHTIRRNGEHLLSVINDILDVSKIEAGQMQVDFRETSLSVIFADLGSLMRHRASQKNLEFRIAARSRLPEIIRTDPTRLRQILFNLVGNAIKFTEKGSITVAVELIHTPDGDKLAISVSDTGIGMTADEVKTLFSPFATSEQPHARRFGGAGLGLTISKRLTEMLGGDITVRSEVGVGTVFIVTVSTGDLTGVKFLEQFGDIIVTRGADAKDAPSVSGRVLLVEGSRDTRRLIEFHLTNMGLVVEHAEDGKHAREMVLAAAKNRSYDLVLMDMQMPDVDGLAAVTSMRIAGYTGPILALTANVMEKDRERCLSVGCDHFLAKPIQLDTFHKTVMFYLRRDPAAARPANPLAAHQARHRGDPRYSSIVDRFLQDLREKSDDLNQSMKLDNLSRVSWIAHQIRGMSGTVGYPGITQSAQIVEEKIREKSDAASIEEAVRKLMDQCREATGEVA